VRSSSWRAFAEKNATPILSFWPSLQVTDQPRENALPRENTLVEIDECGETVSRLCTELLRGTETRPELRAAVRELLRLLDRLDSLDVSR
jgi:hypothetical protein